MSPKLFKILAVTILAVGLVIRLVPARSNNFYFTMDQGNDAVHVREIIYRGQILLRGPETGISGLYHGPLWYYFIAGGYLIFGGHPFGAVFMLIILNLATTALLMYKIAQKVNSKVAILVGASLQFFWWFYDSSRYGFNPFPLVSLSIILILLLADFFEGKKYKIQKLNINPYNLAAIPVGLAYHSETAAALPLTIFYFLVGTIAFAKKRLTLAAFLVSLAIFPLFFIPKIISEVKTGFHQTKVIRRELREPAGVFSQTRYQFVSARFKEIITRRITPQSTEVGVFMLVLVLVLFLATPAKNRATLHFVYLSLALTGVSWIWFGSNKGWQVWHTVYVRPLLFISILLMLANLAKSAALPVKRIAVILLAIVLISQFLFFKDRYLEFAKPGADPSLLTNELAAVDWVYRESEAKGFYVYSYLPSVEDYPYQYLFWWRGTQKYGYVPCEYSTAPGIPDLFVPGLKYYQSPQKPCANLRFLIIEPDTRSNLQKTWLDQTQKDTVFLEEANFGKIRVEKRQI